MMVSARARTVGMCFGKGAIAANSLVNSFLEMIPSLFLIHHATDQMDFEIHKSKLRGEREILPYSVASCQQAP